MIELSELTLKETRRKGEMEKMNCCNFAHINCNNMKLNIIESKYATMLNPFLQFLL
jgi:hypothetical protein